MAATKRGCTALHRDAVSDTIESDTLAYNSALVTGIVGLHMWSFWCHRQVGPTLSSRMMFNVTVSFPLTLRRKYLHQCLMLNIWTYYSVSHKVLHPMVQQESIVLCSQRLFSHSTPLPKPPKLLYTKGYSIHTSTCMGLTYWMNPSAYWIHPSRVTCRLAMIVISQNMHPHV